VVEAAAHQQQVGPWSGSSIHERIQQARVTAGFSRAELARRVGVGPSAAVQWENASGTAPTLENLARIAIATGVAFEWLATGRGSARLTPTDEDPTVVAATFARDLYEERMLTAVRTLPSVKREAVVEFLERLSR
jgi:transcriptional regulator with XRE-family HTH domain